MVKEDGDVLRMNGQVWLDDPEGKKAWRISSTRLDWLDWSISFATPQSVQTSSTTRMTDDFAVIYSELRVYEASPVPIGGSYGTETEQLRQAARDSRSADLEVQRLKLGGRGQGPRRPHPGAARTPFLPTRYSRESRHETGHHRQRHGRSADQEAGHSQPTDQDDRADTETQSEHAEGTMTYAERIEQLNTQSMLG